MTNVRARRGWIAILLCACALLLLGARPAHAQSANCVGTYGGVLDGNVYLYPTPPNLLQIDGDCTIENYPASNPYAGSISWLSTSNALLIFNNVDFIGNMSCDSNSHGDFVWFVNGSITRSHILKCANLFAPVDKIDKQNPPGPPFVSIGVPFTYTLTFPQPQCDRGVAQLREQQRRLEGQRRYGAFHRHERGGPAHLQRFPRDPGRAADRAQSHCCAQQHRAAKLARHAVLQHRQLDVRNDRRRDLPLPAARTAGGLAAAHHRGAQPGDDQEWPGDDEPRATRAVRPQRAEHRQYRRLERDDRGQAADGCDGRHVHSRAADPLRAGGPGRWRDTGAGQGTTCGRHGLHTELCRGARLHADAQHAERRGGDWSDAAPHRHLSDAARCEHAERRHAHQRRWRDAVVQRPKQHPRQPELHSTTWCT